MMISSKCSKCVCPPSNPRLNRVFKSMKKSFVPRSTLGPTLAQSYQTLQSKLTHHRKMMHNRISGVTMAPMTSILWATSKGPTAQLENGCQLIKNSLVFLINCITSKILWPNYLVTPSSGEKKLAKNVFKGFLFNKRFLNVIRSWQE